jgi:hypothetical protein
MISWIPERFAVPGKYLELKNAEKWENGWLVKSASKEMMPEHILVPRSHEWTKHRKTTDI